MINSGILGLKESSLKPMETRGNVVVICTSPNAGSGTGGELVPRLVESLANEGIQVHVSAEIDEIRQLAESLHERGVLRCVVAAGGDGTLSLVTANVPRGAAVLPMPLGTENLLARYIKQEANVEALRETITRGQGVWLDAGMADERLFLIMFSCGFDADVVHEMSRTRRGHIWRLSYLLPTLRSCFRYRFPWIQSRFADQDTSERAKWTFIFNLPCYATGLGIGMGASGTDQQLNYVGFQSGSVWAGFGYLLSIWRRRHLERPDVSTRQGAEIEVASEDARHQIPYQLDGDFAGFLPVRIKLLPKHFKLLVPPECDIFEREQATESADDHAPDHSCNQLHSVGP